MSETAKSDDVKAEKEAAKAAEDQAKQDDADVEAFLSSYRGERLLRGEDGSFDPVAHAAARKARRELEDEQKK